MSRSPESRRTPPSRPPRRCELAGHPYRPARPLDGVVGIDQERRSVGVGAGVGLEGVGFVLEALHIGVGHRPGDRDPEPLPCEDVTGRVEAGEVARPSGLQPGLAPVRPPEAELDQPSPLRSLDAPRGLRGDQRLDVHAVDDERLDELSLDERRGHLEHRLGREEDRPLGHRAYVSAEPEPPQPLQERRTKQSRRLEERKLVFAEPKPLEIVERVLDPGRDEVAPPVREAAAVELKRRLPLGHPLREIALAHRQLVEVEEESRHPAGQR